jgi:hypothetical protein
MYEYGKTHYCIIRHDPSTIPYWLMAVADFSSSGTRKLFSFIFSDHSDQPTTLIYVFEKRFEQVNRKRQSC